MPAIENRVEGCWWNKQTAFQSPAATAFRRGRKVGGDMNVTREDENEPYSSGQRFNTAADFINAISGQGDPVLQGQPGVLGHLAYLLLGQETVTGVADPFTHVATPGPSGFWTTWWKLVGATVAERQKFNDCRLISLRIEASSESKVLKITPTFISLDAGEIFATDPVAIEEPGEPFLYTEAEGTFTIDGTVFRGHSSFAVQINDAVEAWWGDSVNPNDIAFGLGNIVVEEITLLVNAQGLGRYNQIMYGTPTPAAGTKPIKTLGALGSYSFDMTRGVNRQAKIELPGVKWSPDLAIPGNPEGGATELNMSAEARPAGTDPMIRISTKSADPAYA